MLPASKKGKMLNALKAYKKKFIDRNLTELDESGTRLMINTFLSDVLGYLPIEEIKTEYMIKGTYADYLIQVNGIRHFLVEVKALSLQLSEKHLRQTINYGANEGIEWALLTNGRSFDFYKIIFDKPIESRKLFSLDLSDGANLNSYVNHLQYLHKDAVVRKSLKLLWNRCEALNPMNVAGIIYSREVLVTVKKLIRSKYGEKCQEEDIIKSINRIVCEKLDPLLVKPYRSGKIERKQRKAEIAKPSKPPVFSQSECVEGEYQTTLN